jgi:hypoxanthine phosphoribosyltransferase
MVPLSFKIITERLKTLDLPEFDLVIGIGSGGIPPATFVAFYLNTELEVRSMNYRDEKNNPRFEVPKLLKKPNWNLEGKRILLVDDVSVSGKTMNAALELLKGYNVKTLAMKGKADFVLFPEIKDCVKWPWKLYI